MKVAWIVWISILLMATPPLACAADAAAERGPIELSLKRAVEIAISAEGNTKKSARHDGQARRHMFRRSDPPPPVAGNGIAHGHARRPGFRRGA